MEIADDILIAAYIAGDEASLKVLIDRYTPLLYNFARRFVGVNESNDITQEIFIKVWKNITKFDKDKSSFKTWVFTIARNTVTDFLRKKKSIVFTDMALDDEESSFPESIPDDIILPDEALQKIQDASYLGMLLEKISPMYKTVLLLYYQEEMTFAEIGQVLGKPLHTVKSHHRRALIQLRRLTEESPNAPKINF